MTKEASLLISCPSELLQADCACPDGGFSFVKTGSPIQSTLYQKGATLYQKPFASDTSLFFAQEGESNVVLLNSAAVELLDAFESPNSLNFVKQGKSPQAAKVIDHFMKLGLVVPANQQSTITTVPESLSAWIHVTNACNLRCTYCYIEKTDEQMDDVTGFAAVDAILRSAVLQGFSRAQLKYAGGEATLNMGMVRRLHVYAQSCAAELGLEIEGVVLSNGVALTNPTIDWMVENHVRLTISLDGMGDVNDEQRVFINGKGSFKQVSRSIDRAVERGLHPGLSITVTGHNALHLKDIVAFALDRELRFNINFYRESERTQSLAELRFEEEQIIAGVHAAFDVIEARLPSYRLIDSMVDRSAFHSPHEYACGAGHSYMVIDHNGSVSRCQMEIENPVTDVYANDPLEEIKLHPSGFQNQPVDEKEGCRDCTWKYWCAGGCSLMTYNMTGRNDIKSPNCEIYKALYPRLLELEGLRLLKWGSDVAF